MWALPPGSRATTPGALIDAVSLLCLFPSAGGAIALPKRLPLLHCSHALLPHPPAVNESSGEFDRLLFLWTSWAISLWMSLSRLFGRVCYRVQRRLYCERTRCVASRNSCGRKGGRDVCTPPIHLFLGGAGGSIVAAPVPSVSARFAVSFLLRMVVRACQLCTWHEHSGYIPSMFFHPCCYSLAPSCGFL